MVAIEQITVWIDDGLTAGPRLAIERFERGERSVERSEANAGAPGRSVREFVSERDQLAGLVAAVFQPEAHGHIDSSFCLAASAVGRL